MRKLVVLLSLWVLPALALAQNTHRYTIDFLEGVPGGTEGFLPTATPRVQFGGPDDLRDGDLFNSFNNTYTVRDIDSWFVDFGDNTSITAATGSSSASFVSPEPGGANAPGPIVLTLDAAGNIVEVAVFVWSPAIPHSVGDDIQLRRLNWFPDTLRLNKTIGFCEQVNPRFNDGSSTNVCRLIDSDTADLFSVNYASAVSITKEPLGANPPAPFSFIPQTDIAPSTVSVSNTITVSGISTAADIAIVSCSGASCEYAINSGPWTSVAGTVVEGDIVQVRQTSSANFATTTELTLDIGGVTGAFAVTTAPDDPGPDGSDDDVSSPSWLLWLPAILKK